MLPRTCGRRHLHQERIVRDHRRQMPVQRRTPELLRRSKSRTHCLNVLHKVDYRPTSPDRSCGESTTPRMAANGCARSGQQRDAGRRRVGVGSSAAAAACRWLEKAGSARTTTNATMVSTAPASAVLRTPTLGSSTLPKKAPAVMPTLKAVEVPAAAMSEPPGATASTRAPNAAARAARVNPETDIVMTVAT